MFAFAFWKAASGEALLARDALGIKPLYYRADGASFSFASESQVLRRDGDAVDHNALRDFFLWGSIPEPKTLRVQIRQIRAGHWLKRNSSKVEIQQWHSESGSKLPHVRGARPDRTSPSSGVASAPAAFRNQNPKSAAAHTRGALEESVRRHLVSDVSVGIFLSGGIDSTAILALARKELGPNADLRTFSIRFDDPAFDESSLARQTAEHFGTLHSEWRMTPEEGVIEIPVFLQYRTWAVAVAVRAVGTVPATVF